MTNDRNTHAAESGVVWLASYPKSGNTWLRFLLYNYLYGAVRKSAHVAAKIPDIHMRNTPLKIPKSGLVYYKTHFMLSERHPGLNKTLGFIYILRHPKDVLLSGVNYFKMATKLPRNIARFNEVKFAREFIAHMGVKEWIDMGYGTWAEHATSWLSKPRFPHIILRYESMLQDPHMNMQNVLEFLKIPVDQTKLNRAIHSSSFVKMRALEDAEVKRNKFGAIFAGTSETANTGMRFMNNGKAGGTLLHLGENVEREFNEQFKEALRAYSYE